MKSHKIIFWTSTTIVASMSLYGAYGEITGQHEFVKLMEHLGFPEYFRIELGFAQLVGAMALLIPQIPARFKEWAYVGFGITFISAIIAHASTGDGIAGVLPPAFSTLILLVSNIYYHKANYIFQKN